MSHPAEADAEPDSREHRVMLLAAAGNLGAAEALLNEMLADEPENVRALNTLGGLAARQGRFRDAVAHFRRACAIAPEDPHAAHNLAVVLRDLAAGARALYQQGNLRSALIAYRDLLAIDPDCIHAPNSIIHIVAALGEKPRLADFAPGVAEHELGRHIVIACMPKSGSSFLNLALQTLTGWEEAQLTYAFLQNENDIYLPNLRAVARRSTVTQQHCRATEATVQIMQAFRIRPIVQIRNIFDVVVSYADFFDQGATMNTFFQGRWERFERPRRLDLMIDNYVPWYLSFYASWADVVARGRLDCFVVDYEELNADKPGTLKAIADFHGLDKTEADCAETVAQVDAHKQATRYNKARAGRGDELSDAQKARIRALAGYYPDVDFSPIGI